MYRDPGTLIGGTQTFPAQSVDGFTLSTAGAGTFTANDTGGPSGGTGGGLERLDGIYIFGPGDNGFLVVDVPANGSYLVELAIGRTGIAAATGYGFTIVNGSDNTVLHSVPNTPAAAGEAIDAKGNKFTAANFFAGQQGQLITVSGLRFRLRANNNGDGFPVSWLRVTQQ